MAKVPSTRVDDALKRMDGTVRAVLLYGPDLGKVRERANALVIQIVGRLDDPFRVTTLNAADLRENAMRLRDEAASVAFGGGRRVIRMRDPKDELARAFEFLLESEAPDALVVVEAGDLPKRSGIRKLFEAAPNALALPCYPDEGASLDAVISQVLKRDSVTISAEARSHLHALLGPDRALARSEIEKLALHAGANGTIDVDDVQLMIGDTAEASVDDVVYAALGGHPAELDRSLRRSYADGVHPVSIIRATCRHLARLMAVSAQVRGGSNLDDAVSALRPPIFFRRLATFKAQARSWQDSDLRAAYRRAIETEVQLKTTANPAEVICHRSLMELAQAARQQGRPL